MEFDKLEIIGLITVLSSVVVALWRINVASMKKEEKRLEDCEDKHEEANKQVIMLTGEYKELKGRMDGVEKLSQSVLEELIQNRKGSNK